MIESRDRITLAPGVTLDGDAVVDAARGLRVAASPSAALVLAHADGRTIASVGELLAHQGAPDGERDALEFCTELNRRLLLNVRIRPATLARRAAAAAARGLIPHVPPRRVRSLPLGLLQIGVVLTAVTAPLALLLGAWPLVLGVVVGVVLHELAHVVALHGLPRALVVNGLRPSVVHPRLAGTRAFVVASAGPLVPALMALLAVASWQASAVACAPLAVHALGLTVLAPDGRHACGLS
jgi:hypothetical protein